MAVDKRTAFLQAYKELVTFFPFLSTFFLTRPRDIVNAESVKIDIMRGGRKIAPVISNITQIGGKIEKSTYTQKEMTPPVVALAGDFAPGDLIEKAFGKDEYTSSLEDYTMQLMDKIIDTMLEIEGQFSRNIEYQAAQILQTGELSLKDKDGNVAYTIDFFPKSTHFVTVSTSWSDSNSDPYADISNLYQVIKKDGKVNANNIIFGRTALENFLKNAKVEDRFDNSRINAGLINVESINPDVTLLGEVVIGANRFKAWFYEGMYDDPSTGLPVPFVADDKVILIPDVGAINTDLRKVYCRVPTITGVDPRFSSMIPSNMNLDNRAYTTRVWTDGNADTLNVELKTRPLLIPVSIDCFGCLDTEI
jgi:hypothetical protein